jgi:hexosaminidase
VAAPGDASGLARPLSIPALQQWTAGQDTYELGSDAQIVLRTESAEALADTAETFAADLKAFGDGIGSGVIVTDGAAAAGAIVLELTSPDPELGQEGYGLSVTQDLITVGAPTVAGVFYGTRTLLQLFNQSTTVPGGQARDWPAYAERGFMVDLARMEISYDWLANAIRNMGALKLNALHLHLTDSEGWRIESSYVHASQGALTRTDVKNLVDLAAKYQVTVIPEIDLPSHQAVLLSQYPDYQLKGADGAATCNPTDVENCTADGYQLGRLDYTIPEARQLLKNIIAEYIEWFPGPYWHLGADEYLASTGFSKYPHLLAYAQDVVGPNAVAQDGYIHLINEMNQFVKDHGKQARMWNDVLTPGTTIEVDTDVIIDWWTDADADDIIGSLFGSGTWVPFSPQQLLNKGYQVLNSSFLPTYHYSPGGHTPPITIECMYARLDVTKFLGYLYNDSGANCGPIIGSFKTVTTNLAGLRGSRLTNWNSTQPGVPPWDADPIVAQGMAWESLYPRLRIVAQTTWGSPKYASSLSAFQSAIADVGAPTPTALELSESSWAPAGEGESTTVALASNLATQVSHDAGWLTVEATPGGLVLTADPNPLPSERTAVVTIDGVSLTRTIAVTQARAPDLLLTVTATPRCTSGKIQLSVLIQNGDVVPAQITINSAFGAKSFASVAAGKSASNVYTTRVTTLEAGSVTLTGTGLTSQADLRVELAASYGDFVCG